MGWRNKRPYISAGGEMSNLTKLFIVFLVLVNLYLIYDSTCDSSKPNVILTWDGETGEIKSVEILK